jgi:hypothetical protein
MSTAFINRVELATYKISDTFPYLIEQLSSVAVPEREIYRSNIIYYMFFSIIVKILLHFLNSKVSKYLSISNISDASEGIIFYYTEFCTL